MNKKGISFIEILMGIAVLGGIGYAFYTNGGMDLITKKAGLPAQATQAVELHNAAVQKSEAEHARLKCELAGGTNCEGKH